MVEVGNQFEKRDFMTENDEPAMKMSSFEIQTKLMNTENKMINTVQKFIKNTGVQAPEEYYQSFKEIMINTESVDSQSFSFQFPDIEEKQMFYDESSCNTQTITQANFIHQFPEENVMKQAETNTQRQ